MSQVREFNPNLCNQQCSVLDCYSYGCINEELSFYELSPAVSLVEKIDEDVVISSISDKLVEVQPQSAQAVSTRA